MEEGGIAAPHRLTAWHARRPASWQAASLVPGGQPGDNRAESIFSSKVDFHFILSYFSSEKNPRACSGFEDLNFNLSFGFEHQEGDSDLC